MAEPAPRNPLAFKAGETILRPSDSVPQRQVYQVISGYVRILCTDKNGDILVLRHVAPGGYFGEESLVDGKRRYSAEAVIETKIQIIDTRKLNANRSGQLAADLIKAIGETYTYIQRISSQRLRNRLAAALLELASSPLAQRDSRGQTTILITHDELAATIGSVRETTTRTIGELVKLGLVRSGYGRLRLLDLEGLSELAELSY
ncbi:helix-turn-helix domain-containing protein [Oceanithermus sp.]